MKFLALIQSEFLKEARLWDQLTLEEQKGYLSRHPKSKRKITAQPPLKSPGGLAIHDPHRGHAFKILKSLRHTLGVEGRPEWKKYLTFRSGGSNKFHYFAIFPKDKGYVAANAFGRIGYDPKVSVIGETNSKDQAMAMAEKKLNKKEKKGYKITAL